MEYYGMDAPEVSAGTGPGLRRRLGGSPTRAALDGRTGGEPAGQSRERGVEHGTSTLGMGLVSGGDAWFFPLREMDEASAPYRMEVGGQSVTIHYSESGRTACAHDSDGTMLVAALAYEPRWLAIFPEWSVFER